MNEKPKLGTTDSALVNCVNLIAAVTATRTEELIGYLDLYYQVRRTWEIEQICQASEGALSERKIMDALNAAQLSQEEWRALEKTLNAVMMLQMPEGPEK